MITRLTSTEELKEILIEILLNKTNKVSKVSDGSVLNGIVYANAKVAQKALKDIALVETHLFPDSAFGLHLDVVADNLGIASRFGASESSTFVRVVGDVGTVYTAGVQTFTGSHGFIFDLENTVVLGAAGYSYAKIRSQDTGLKVNVDPLSINQVDPVPLGHQFTVNEYQATGGRDAEQDDVFRKRIKEGANLAARGTLSYITQVFNKINNNVLDVLHTGTNLLGQSVLAVVTQNGIDLNPSEIDDLKTRGQEYLSLTELNPFGSELIGVDIVNIEYQPIDVSFRVELFNSTNPDQVRKEIQVRMAKALDFRFWEADQKVEWDDLLQIVKGAPGIKYVVDTYFSPSEDVLIETNKYPRIRGFLMLDRDGNILSDVSGVLSPVFYPADADFSFQQTILNTI